MIILVNIFCLIYTKVFPKRRWHKNEEKQVDNLYPHRGTLVFSISSLLDYYHVSQNSIQAISIPPVWF